jgi:hypothetical protein
VALRSRLGCVVVLFFLLGGVLMVWGSLGELYVDATCWRKYVCGFGGVCGFEDVCGVKDMYELDVCKIL